MATHDIPRETWREYLEQFTCKHKGASVRIETIDNNSTPDVRNECYPLVSIAFDRAGGEMGSIAIQLAHASGQAIIHVIDSPKHVYHKTGAGIISDEVNSHEVLEITAASHPAITHLQFRPRS